MIEAKVKLLTEGLKIVHQIQGFIQFSYLGNSERNVAIMKELDKLEQWIEDLKWPH